MVTDGRGKSKTRRNHSQEMGKYDWELLLESTRSSLESNFEPWKRIFLHIYARCYQLG